MLERAGGGRREVMPAAVGSLEAFVFGDSGAGVLVAVEEQADGPGLRICFWVFDARFVLHRVAAKQGVAFDDVQLVAVKISGGVEPGLVAQVGYVGDERVA